MPTQPISHRYRHLASGLLTAILLSACGIKGGLYLAPNQLPNAKPPAGSEDAQKKQAEEQIIPAEALRNPSTASPADMLTNPF
jgi:predicted small lipoprotein YifL